ncbi:YlxR family protein [Gleimia sp. 6138-11-ORH1]|uniref:YlxR family protein n=1 Tax=Gleimia sp. 6138-11-ORH1 TaxID=2973937 RepID=UPI002166F6B0|nr:YlxR family protein [Gleimia sp. 6138-11-ORH1]MCS4484216.1 YlxR family protein [Gleimia sp. 6138-11-ORH1]
MAHPIMRQCVGCKEVTDRRNLVRCVYVAETETVEVDSSQTAPGRGAWVHAKSKCVQRAIRNRGFVRTLKLTELGKTFDNSADAWQKLVTDVLQCTRCTLQQS